MNIRLILNLGLVSLVACTPNLGPRVRDNIEAIPGLGARDIDIRQEGRNITLSGQVSSERDRTLIISAASQTPGVEFVNNSLTVIPVETSAVPGRVVTISPSGSRAAAIQSGILSDPSLTGYNITISEEGGVATLSGSVQRYEDRAAIVEIARSTPGIMTVRDNIAVVS